MRATSIPVTCRFRVYLYGPLEVWKRETDEIWKLLPKEIWRGERVIRSAFRRYLIAPGRYLSTPRAANDIWPDSDIGDQNLHRAMAAIRSFLGHELVTKIESGYQLAGPDLIWVDAEAALSLLNQAERRENRLDAIPLLEEALHLLGRGEYLENEGGTWCYQLRKPHEIMLKRCHLWLAQGYEMQGRLLQAALSYQVLLQGMPPDEEALQCYLLLLHRQGRTGEALHYWQDIRGRVEEEGYSLSPVFEDLITEMRARPLFPRVQISLETSEALILPGRAASLFSFETAGQSPFLEKFILPDTLYDRMETEVIAAAIHWRRSSTPLASLQRTIQDIFRKHDTMHQGQPENENRLTRRQALQAIAALPIDVYGVKLLSETVLLPSDDLLPLCAAGLSACWELRRYEPEGMHAIQRVLALYLPTLEKLAHQSSPSQRSAAYLAAQGYLLAGVIANHHGKLEQMEAASRASRLYAQMAQDVDLEVAALIRLAVKFDVDNHEVKALETYQEVAALPGFSSVSPLLRSRVYAGLASKLAYCQQGSEALSSLSQAKEVYPANLESDSGLSFAGLSCNSNSLAVYEGLTFKHIGRYAEAMEVFARIGSLVPLPGLPETSRAENLTYAASVAIKQRDLDAAFCYLNTAEDILKAIRHEQLHTEVCTTFKGMKLLWPDEPKVKALQEKMYAH